MGELGARNQRCGVGTGEVRQPRPRFFNPPLPGIADRPSASCCLTLPTGQRLSGLGGPATCLSIHVYQGIGRVRARQYEGRHHPLEERARLLDPS